MRATSSITVTIDPATNVRAPDAVLPVGGTLGFLPSGNLLVIKPRTGGRAEIYEFAAGAEGWTEARKVDIKSSSGSRSAGAVSPDGERFAFGPKTAKVYAWPSGKAVASAGAVKYQLAINSVGFSPSGAWLVVADGGRVSPRARTVAVVDAKTGEKRATIKTDEWCFVQAGMLDEDTVVTLGLGLDWDLAKGSTDEDVVLGCYDVTTGDAKWRRVLHGGQRVRLDSASRQIWIADDVAPHGTGAVLCLAADDGHVLRSISFGAGWRAGKAPPIVVRPGLVVVEVTGDDPKQKPHVLLLDVEAGRQIATLQHEDGSLGYHEDYFAAVHASSQWLAMVDRFGDDTHLWRLA